MALTDILALASQRAAVLKHMCKHTGVPEKLRITVKAWVLASASKVPRIKSFYGYN